MAKKAGILTKVRSVVRSHITWLVASILGTDSVTAEERASLSKFKLGKPILDFLRRSFLLGKLFAKVPTNKRKKITTADLDEFSASYKLTPLDEVALAYSKTRAAAYVYSVADDMASSVVARMAASLGQSMLPSIKEAVTDEVTAALAANKQLKDFASSLANKLKINYKDRLVVIASTELHHARIQGLVQSIVQQQDVYKYGDGVDSLVSIVPRPGTCPDCAKHYLDSKGNPKVHKLRELIHSGSNADPGTKHTSKRGIHLHWKTTLPPMHPSCRCEVVFIPTGFSWVKGELKLTDPRKFHKSFELRKAVSSSRMTAVAKPKGPPKQAASVAASAKPGNIPGVAAPQKAPSFGSAATVAAPTGTAGGKGGPSFGSADTWIYPKPGQDTSGPGWESYEKRDGTFGKRKKAGTGGGSSGDDQNGELSPEQVAQAVQASKAYGMSEHPRTEVLDKLKNAKVVAKQSLSNEEGVVPGVTGSGFIAILENGGRAMAKPKDAPIEIYNGIGGTVPGQGVHAEKAVDSVGTLLGLNMTQATEVRNLDGMPHSMQAWNEKASPIGDTAGDEHPTASSYLLSLATTPEEEQHIKDQLGTMAALAVVSNLADQHSNNVLINKEDKTIHAIDNSASFGTGLAGVASFVFNDARKTGRHVKVPDHVVAKLENTSYSDVKKALPNLKPWQATQAFIRMKYVAHLQKTEGRLDHNKFMPVWYPDGTDSGLFASMSADELEDFSMPHRPYWGSAAEAANVMKEFTKRKENKTLPDDLFQGFMANYFNEIGLDSPEVTEMLQTGPFVNPGMELHRRLTSSERYINVHKQRTRARELLRRDQGKSVSERFPTAEKKFQDMMAAEANTGSDARTGAAPLNPDDMKT